MAKFDGVDRIYVVHYTKLTERREHLEGLLSEILNPVTWVDMYDREVVTPEEIDKYIRPDARKMTLAQKAITVSHMHIYEDIKCEGYHHSLVLEDDVVFKDGFIETFNKLWPKMPETYDLVHINDYLPLKKKVAGENFYKEKKTRTVSSYLVSLKGAIKIASKRTSWVIDHDLNGRNLEIYWMEPTIAAQGSKTDKFKTSYQRP